MPRTIKIVLTIFCLLHFTQARADSWMDPSWKQMLDSTEVIALIEYTGDGDFRASATILKVYKGSLKAGDNIFISGFSNRYGPIDKAKKGDRYLVFINFNKPTADRLSYYEKELVKDPGMKEYVEAYRNGKAYYVWTPTSGDLKVKGATVQYDLLRTSYSSEQQYYSLPEFEAFLKACFDRSMTGQFINGLLQKIRPVKEHDVIAQYLMALFLLGHNSYDPVFKSYVQVKNPSVKYALAQLMGNIKSEQARSILFALLDDKSSLVQGEAVRQLRKELAELVAPVFLKHLTAAGNENFGPSNIMDPVMNTIDGAKFEIIKALGDFKYRPAIPQLLPLLDTDEDQLFSLVVNALKNIGSRDYIPYINKHLDNKTTSLIFELSGLIASDSLVECLPALKRFISSCNRNDHPDYDYTISDCCGIGKFSDTATIAFLLSDYEQLLLGKDTLESRKLLTWTRSYIETFSELGVAKARPLIYASIYDWHGINEDFARNPGLFTLRKRVEDSLRSVFATSLSAKGYVLDHCMAYITNTKEVINGERPELSYLVQVTIPGNDSGDAHQLVVSNALGLPNERVYIRFGNGVYHERVESRFEQHFYSSPLYSFLKYAIAVPDPADLKLLQAITDSNYYGKESWLKNIKETIAEIKKKLDKEGGTN